MVLFVLDIPSSTSEPRRFHSVATIYRHQRFVQNRRVARKKGLPTYVRDTFARIKGSAMPTAKYKGETLLEWGVVCEFWTLAKLVICGWRPTPGDRRRGDHDERVWTDGGTNREKTMTPGWLTLHEDRDRDRIKPSVEEIISAIATSLWTILTYHRHRAIPFLLPDLVPKPMLTISTAWQTPRGAVKVKCNPCSLFASLRKLIHLARGTR